MAEPWLTLLPWVQGAWHGAVSACLGVGAPCRPGPQKAGGAGPATWEPPAL